MKNSMEGGLFRNKIDSNQEVKKNLRIEQPLDMENLSVAILSEAENLEIRESDRNEKGELLVSPDGLVSNLGKQSELWWKIARTESFKKWFGDWQNDSKSSSKVIDQNQEPLVLFRGVTRDIRTFSDFYNTDFYKRGTASGTTFGSGVYTTPLPKSAFGYANHGSVFPAFVNAKKPRYAGTLKGMMLESIRRGIWMIIPEKFIKHIPEMPLFDSVFGESNNPDKEFTKKAEEVLEILVKNPSQILIIPSSINKPKDAVAEYAQNTKNKILANSI
ncbi:MAG: hypothetical protein NTX85_02175 [Candidatus Nomurabacteria bacterium]|nr:hypothetical protein [Candidatus Nomurabacteria bacterium]